MNKLLKLKLFVLLLVVVFPALSFANKNCSGNNCAGDYWLDFNPYSYRTEYFTTTNNAIVGSCSAATVLIVENHLLLHSSISSNAANDAVKNKNSQMGCTLSGSFYICSITTVQNRFNADGYRTSWLGVSSSTSNSKDTAVYNIFNALGANKWVVIVASYGFNPGAVAHFYPVYGGVLKKTSTGAIDYNNSKLYVIDSNPERFLTPANRVPFAPNNSWVTNDTRWSWIYVKPSLSSVMTAMTSGNVNYNILAVTR